MVHEVKMFQCGVTGRRFDDEEAASQCEKRAQDFQDTFRFHKDVEIKSDDFIQYDKEHYDKIVDGIVGLMKKWEPGLYKIFESNGGKPFITGIIGRYFDDGKNTRDFYT